MKSHDRKQYIDCFHRKISLCPNRESYKQVQFNTGTSLHSTHRLKIPEDSLTI